MLGIKPSALQRPGDTSHPPGLSAAGLLGRTRGGGDSKGTPAAGGASSAGTQRRMWPCPDRLSHLPGSAGGWHGPLPGEESPPGPDNRVLCSPDKSTCPGAGSRPGAPYGGELPLAVAVPSRLGASLGGMQPLAWRAAPEPCGMRPRAPITTAAWKCNHQVQRWWVQGGREHQFVPGRASPRCSMACDTEGAAGEPQWSPALRQNLASPWGFAAEQGVTGQHLG